MPFQAERIDHVEVFVRDLEASAAWYARVLGLEEVMRFDPHPIMIGVRGTMLALFQAPEGQSSHPPSLGNWRRVAWKTDRKGFAAAQEHLSKLGVDFTGPIDHDVAHSIYFQDPDGNPLEITYYLTDEI